jgi:hypothetical protein
MRERSIKARRGHATTVHAPKRAAQYKEHPRAISIKRVQGPVVPTGLAQYHILFPNREISILYNLAL